MQQSLELPARATLENFSREKRRGLKAQGGVEEASASSFSGAGRQGKTHLLRLCGAAGRRARCVHASANAMERVRVEAARSTMCASTSGQMPFDLCKRMRGSGCSRSGEAAAVACGRICARARSGIVLQLHP